MRWGYGGKTPMEGQEPTTKKQRVVKEKIQTDADVAEDILNELLTLPKMVVVDTRSAVFASIIKTVEGIFDKLNNHRYECEDWKEYELHEKFERWDPKNGQMNLIPYLAKIEPPLSFKDKDGESQGMDVGKICLECLNRQCGGDSQRACCGRITCDETPKLPCGMCLEHSPGIKPGEKCTKCASQITWG